MSTTSTNAATFQSLSQHATTLLLQSSLHLHTYLVLPTICSYMRLRIILASHGAARRAGATSVEPKTERYVLSQRGGIHMHDENLTCNTRPLIHGTRETQPGLTNPNATWWVVVRRNFGSLL